MRRPAAAVTAATLAAGLIGVVRQRREATAVRRGELAPASAASEITPRRTDAFAEAVAAWVPPRPGTPAGRAAASAWAAPMTAIGLIVAAVATRRWRWDDARGCVVATGARGPSSLALRLVGADANTIGQVVVCRLTEPSATLLDHEAVHVRHGERLGPLLFPAYVWLSAVYGYRDHPMERAARTGARRQRTG